MGCTGNQHISLSLFTAILNQAIINPSLTYLFWNVHSAVFLWPNESFLISLKINIFIKIEYFKCLYREVQLKYPVPYALYSSKHKNLTKQKHHKSPTKSNCSSRWNIQNFQLPFFFFLKHFLLNTEHVLMQKLDSPKVLFSLCVCEIGSCHLKMRLIFPVHRSFLWPTYEPDWNQ